jgi:hypothetical protein
MDPAAQPDPLDDLRERLQATREAAERLAEDPPRVPPQGWATPPRGDGPGDANEVTELIRQVLLLVRALVDHWIERLEGERGGEPEVEDIPIA